jgi:hypothetical protein
MGVLVTNLFLFTDSSLIGQVTMKEKSTFTLHTVREVSSTRTMHISACWNSASFAQVDVYRTLEPYVEQCDLWTFRGTSSLSGDVPLCAGEYEFDFQILVDVPLGQSFPAYFKASIGADTVINESTIFGNYGNGGPLYTPWDLPPYANPLPSRFKLSIGATVLYENPLTLSISKESDCSYDSWDPARDSVTIRILSGADYVSWHNISRAKVSGTVITALAAQMNNLLLVADGHLPTDSGATVVLEASANGITRTTSVLVKPYHISVLVDPPLVPVGEKARIILQIVDADGAPYSPLLFPYARIRITDSTQYGTLSYGDFWGYFSETGDSLCDVIIDGPDASLGRSLKFLANEQSPADSVQIHFTVEKTGDCCTIYPRQLPYLYPYDGLDTVRASGAVTVKNNDILLGETKYYQATLDPFDYSTVIKEYSTPQDSDLSGVEFHVDTVSGSKLGVYYEYKDSTGAPLPTDQIRLVGRYWQKDSTYRVRLRAIYADTASIVIEVKRPKRLGSTNNTTTDVSNRQINLDSIIVKYAGENGIPPQIIKGQMQKETSFQPSWRYEPFYDYSLQKSRWDDYFANGLPFVVSSDSQPSMGSGDAIPDGNSTPPHSNVRPVDYIRSPTTIAEFATRNWFSSYVQHLDDGLDRIIGSYELTNAWTELYYFFRDSSDGFNEAQAKDAAHERLKENLMNGSAGRGYLDPAQTRTVTSYGFIQMLYVSAVDNPFYETQNRYAQYKTRYMTRAQDSPPPEKLNEYDFLLPRYSDLLLKKLVLAYFGLKAKDYLPGLHILECQWQEGYDATWTGAVQRYNSGEAGYGKKVVQNSQHFKPSN